MKALYLDIFSGISGDMFIGAMLDLGVSPQDLGRELEKLGLGEEFHLHVSRGERGAIAGTKFDVHLAHGHAHDHHGHDHDHATDHHHHEDGEHDHLAEATYGPHGGPLLQTRAGRIEVSVFETNVPPRFRLYFYDRHGHAAKPPRASQVSLRTIRDGKKKQEFSFVARGEFLEAKEELPEPHEFEAVVQIKQGGKAEKFEIQFVEEHHHHNCGDCGHDHEHHHDAHAEDEHHHGHEHPHDHEHGRTFAQIREMIQRSKLSPWVKEKSVAVFHRIAVAEGKIHGHPPEEVHFHEVGAIDSIVDIVGACIALELLGKPRVLASMPVEGVGTIRCAHGTFPIPAPATLEILSARGVAISQCEEPGELITPTGAALLAEFAETFEPLSGFAAEKIGYGLGTRQNKTRPNVLRAVLGRVEAETSTHDWETDTVAVLETNLDDISAELLGAFVEKALARGALDVFHTPVQMKKNRPGVLLTVLCDAERADEFTELMLRETTAFGVRRTSAQRRKLRREMTQVKTAFGEIAVKRGTLNGQTIHLAPEFESCRAAAERAQVTTREVFEAAVAALRRK
jgi:pyridinium-3,5-bisthiocarboxylic acid mononucleotide nickel chelatase